MSGALRSGAVGVVLCAIAGAFGVAALYVPGVALVLLAVAAWGSVTLSARGATLALELGSEQVVEGEDVAVRVHVERSLPGISRGVLRASPGAPWVELGRRTRVRRLELRAHRRGELVVGPAVVRYADPFGICARELAAEPRRLLVLPRVEAVRSVDLERLLAQPAARASSDGDGGIDGLAPYREGAPASRIHWLTVARTGELLERVASGEGRAAAAMVVLDTRSPAGVDAVDRAVRAAASLCAALARAGGCSLLLPGHARAQALGLDLRAWPHLLAELALVERGRAPEWRAAREARRIVLVSAGEPRLPAGGGARVTCTVSPLQAERGAVLFRVAGCDVRAVGRARARAA